MGGLIAPQLDGIGNRGLERIVEDVVDPNRNVDVAFRYSTIATVSEDTLTGLYRREEGELLVFADAAGNEFSVSKSDVAERTESDRSLMPEMFDQLLPEGDMNDLLAYLLSTASPAN